MALLLQGIVAGGGALHGNGIRLDLKGLLCVGSENQLAGDDKSSTHVGLGDLLEIVHGVVVNHLDGGEISTVIQHDKAKLLAGPDGAHPAADGDGLTSVIRRVLKQVSDRNQFHNLDPLS